MVVALCQRMLGTPAYWDAKQYVIVLKPQQQFIFLQNVGPYYQTTRCPKREAYNINLHQYKYLPSYTLWLSGIQRSWSRNLLRCCGGALAWWVGGCHRKHGITMVSTDQPFSVITVIQLIVLFHKLACHTHSILCTYEVPLTGRHPEIFIHVKQDWWWQVNAILHVKEPTGPLIICRLEIIWKINTPSLITSSPLRLGL